MKKLTVADLKAFRDRLYLPRSRLGAGGRPAALLPPRRGLATRSQYMQERRAGLGGYLPQRVVRAKAAHAAYRRGVRRAAGAARASSRSPPPWRWSGCSRT